MQELKLARKKIGGRLGWGQGILNGLSLTNNA